MGCFSFFDIVRKAAVNIFVPFLEGVEGHVTGGFCRLTS